MLKILTSGRFDPPHPGHICNFTRICKLFKESNPELTVVVLDDGSQRYPLSYRVDVLKEIADELKYDIEIAFNTVHFGEISKEELGRYETDVYCGGNLQVLGHIQSLGFPTSFIDRSYYYEASKIPLPE